MASVTNVSYAVPLLHKLQTRFTRHSQNVHVTHSRDTETGTSSGTVRGTGTSLGTGTGSSTWTGSDTVTVTGTGKGISTGRNTGTGNRQHARGQVKVLSQAEAQTQTGTSMYLTEGDVLEALLRVELLVEELRDSLSPALSLPESKFSRVPAPSCFATCAGN